jgi:hypothetical protein
MSGVREGSRNLGEKQELLLKSPLATFGVTGISRNAFSFGVRGVR